MNLPDSIELDDLIEAYVDGDLAETDSVRMAAAASIDPVLRGRIALARSVRAELAGLDAPPCPPHVVAAVVAAARRDAARKAWRSITDRMLMRGVDWRPVVAMASLVLAVVLAARVGAPSRPEPAPDVAEALEQVKWTLAFLSDVGDRTALVLRDDVMEPHVIRPMSRAVSHVFAATPQTIRNQ